MRKIILILLIIPISFTYSQISLDDIKSQIAEMQEAFVENMMNNDYVSGLKYYAANAYSLPSYEPMLQGKDAMQKSGEEMAKSGMKWKDFKMETVEIMTSGDLVVEIGTYSSLMEMPGMPMEYPDKGKYINVYKVQEDGNLLIIADTWNSDLNPWDEMKKMMPPPPPKPPK